MEVKIFQGGRQDVQRQINEWLQGDGRFAAVNGLRLELSTACDPDGEIIVTVLASWSD